VEAAHLRVGSINDGKPYTGMQEKPSDRWALPLCSKHHREQHSMNELEFWASYNINPFEQCQKHQVKVRNPMPKFPFEKRKKEE